MIDVKRFCDEYMESIKLRVCLNYESLVRLLKNPVDLESSGQYLFSNQ
jgi:hypothetical protein